MERGAIVKIKLLRQYSIHAAGRTVDCESEIAGRLIVDGVAVAVDPPAEIETASVEPEVERAALTPRKKRGRPRNAIPEPEAADPAGG